MSCSANSKQGFGRRGRPHSMKLSSSRPNSIYPRFSEMSEEFYSAPQSPQHQNFNSFHTSQSSVYHSAPDVSDTADVDVTAGQTFHVVDIDGKSKMTQAEKPEEHALLTTRTTTTNITNPVNSRINMDLYFRDGHRRIDFVLAYTTDGEDECLNCEIRKSFEQNLKRDGLKLEYETENSGQLHFVKVHAPFEVICRYAEIMKLKMPVKQNVNTDTWRISSCMTLASDITAFMMTSMDPVDIYNDTKDVHTVEGLNLFQRISQVFKIDSKIFKPREKRHTTKFLRSKEFLFDIPEDPENFFTSSQRSLVVDFILKRQPYNASQTNPKLAFGISRLLADKVYAAAYPLHEGLPGKGGQCTDIRVLLRQEWASVKKMYKLQPLDYIRDYFGEMVGLYFSWLGFYTFMLIPASIVGLACFIYGLATMRSFVPSNDICDPTLNVVMCPVCDFCNYWMLNDTCIYSHLVYLVDNPAMVVFAVFMSVWGTIFLELWKRYSSSITYYWDLSGFDQAEEHPRPEYLALLSSKPNVKKKKNIITNKEEPYVSFWRRRFPAAVMSVSIVLLLVSVAVVAVVAIIIYRMSIRAVLAVQYDGLKDDNPIKMNAAIITTSSAAVINLICLLLLNRVYARIAEKLTEFEMPRTQTEYDDSITLKMFLLQFVNYYASIFYIAFFKGKVIGYPGHYERIFGYRQEECGPGGCLLELAIQLSIIMVGKQALNMLIEMVNPQILRWIKTCQSKFKTQPSPTSCLPSWEQDYHLADEGGSLFWEYLELVLQFGFVTIFVSAFPLAPFFALLNNCLELRLDGKKFLNLCRRPVARRVRDIGVWYRILDCIGKLSVITNAFIIAFTSNFIPRLVYKYKFSSDGTLNGYVNFSLSYFHIEDFDHRYYRPSSSVPANLSYCRYEDYREYPSSNADDTYNHTSYFWYLLVARLSFVVVFENIIMLMLTLMKWLVPDMPANIRNKLKRDIYLTNEIIVEQEAARARIASAREKTKLLNAATSTREDNVVESETIDSRQETESMV